MAKFTLVEYINPKFTIEEGFGQKYRKLVSRSWERFEEREVEMTADEVKQILEQVNREGRYIEAVKDGAVWAWSNDWAIEEETGKSK